MREAGKGGGRGAEKEREKGRRAVSEGERDAVTFTARRSLPRSALRAALGRPAVRPLVRSQTEESWRGVGLGY